MTTDVDPFRHMLSTQRHLWDEEGAAARQAVTFTEQAEMSRRTLAGEPGAEPAREVGIASTEAFVAASLLREFSARLRHEVGAGVVAADAERLAELADELVDRLYGAADARG